MCKENNWNKTKHAPWPYICWLMHSHAGEPTTQFSILNKEATLLQIPPPWKTNTRYSPITPYSPPIHPHIAADPTNTKYEYTSPPYYPLFTTNSPRGNAQAVLTTFIPRFLLLLLSVLLSIRLLLLPSLSLKKNFDIPLNSLEASNRGDQGSTAVAIGVSI